jgi:hypothetical protein
MLNMILLLNCILQRVAFVAVTMKLRGEIVSVIQVYAPHQGRPTEEKMDFENTLQQVGIR